MSYIHSFSITEKYVILFFYPVIIDPTRFTDSNFHVFELFQGNSTGTTEIFVVDLKSGDVKGPFTTGYFYAAHHANAYEINSSEIAVDITPTPFENLRDYLILENMLNPPKSGSKEAEVSTAADLELTRFRINLLTKEVTSGNFPNKINSRFINKFDFPIINEQYRGKNYCVLYGVSAYAYSRTALVKKNLCNPEKDKVRIIVLDSIRLT